MASDRTRTASAVAPPSMSFMMTAVGAQWIAARPPADSKAGTTYASKAPRTTRAHFNRVAVCSSAISCLIVSSESRSTVPPSPRRLVAGIVAGGEAATLVALGHRVAAGLSLQRRRIGIGAVLRRPADGLAAVPAPPGHAAVLRGAPDHDRSGRAEGRGQGGA